MRVGVLLFVVAAILAAGGSLRAYGADVNDEPPAVPPAATSDDQPLLGPDELDDLLAPIALYPDPLLAQILPAATEPQDIAAAQAWVAAGNNPDGVDDQDWDPSV